QMAATRSRDMVTGERQLCAAVPLQRFRMLEISVDDNELQACRHAYQCVWMQAPPIPDHLDIRRGVLEPSLDKRRLGVFVTREHGRAAICKSECCRELHGVAPKCWRLNHRPPRSQASHTSCATCGPTPGMTVNRIPPQLQGRKTPSG